MSGLDRTDVIIRDDSSVKHTQTGHKLILHIDIVFVKLLLNVPVHQHGGTRVCRATYKHCSSTDKGIVGSQK